MTLEEAIAIPVKDHKRIPVTYKGKKYKNLKSLCVSVNVNYDTVRFRIKRGMALEQAIETPIKTNK